MPAGGSHVVVRSPVLSLSLPLPLPPSLSRILSLPLSPYPSTKTSHANTVARAVGLALLHAGPACLLGLCFQLGELCGKLDRPWRWEKLRLLGHMWDFSFGSDEPAPPKLMHAVARGQWLRVLAASLAACAIEWAATQHAPLAAARVALEAALTTLHPPSGFGSKSRVLSAASAASAAAASTPPPGSPPGTSHGHVVPNLAACVVGVGVHAAALLVHHILRRPCPPTW